MSAYGKSKLAWSIFRRFGLGSNHHLGKPLLFKASRLHSGVSPLFDQCKMGFSGSITNVVGRRYYNAGNFKQTSTITKQTLNPKSDDDALTSAVICALGVTAALCSVTDLDMSHGGKTLPREYKYHGFRDYLKATHGSETVLPPTHPTRERVARIAHNVFDALRWGLEDNNVWGGRVYALGATQKSLDIYWEVFVVDDPHIDRVDCFEGGKIVVYTGVLDSLKSDAEIAYTIAHEVALAVARPYIEKFTIFWGSGVVTACTYCITGDVARCHERLVVLLPLVFITMQLSRKVKQTADAFGLLLTASAGYHPQFAVKMSQFSVETQTRAMAVYQTSLWSLEGRD